MVKKVSRRKKLLFSVVLFLFLYFFVELISFIFFLVREGGRFSFSQFQARRLAISHSDELIPAWRASRTLTGSYKVIHPYIGYVTDPTRRSGYSEYGFPGKNPLLVSKDKNTLIIGIFGGSFAREFSESGRNALIQELKQSSTFREKDIIIHTLATEGHKQPQQVSTLVYFLTLGVQFDIIVNIDGFNELVIAEKNISKNVFPFFPENWLGKIGNLNNPEMLIMIGEIAFFTAKRKSWANLFATTPLRYNIFSNLLWKSYDTKLTNTQLQKALELEQYRIKRKEHAGYVATGPSFHYDTESEMYETLALVWKRSSIHMHELAEANEIEYFHFLQPNQYVPGSKIMKAEELKIAFAENQPYRPVVENGYPYLIKESKDLIYHGVNFFDLTMIFSKNDEILYNDNCCHLNDKGYSIIGATIGKTLVEQSKGRNGDE
jgi:hypothetical protein